MKLGDLKEKPWYLRLAVFAGIALVVYTGFWFLVTRGIRAETKELTDQIAVLLPRNAQAQIASQRLNEFRAAYKSREEEYDELKALLPEQRELTTVLQGIQDRARSSNLTVRKFSPKDDVQQDFYSGKRIEVGVNSSFAGLRQFFDQMSRYQRIVSISNFNISQTEKQLSGNTVDATFSLTAYYVSAEKLQKSAAPAPGQPGAPPASPAAAAVQPATK
jgi:type IV pilus assembly protein PilO